MIFDYMDHDLTGLLERVKRDRDGPGHFTVPQASARRSGRACLAAPVAFVHPAACPAARRS